MEKIDKWRTCPLEQLKKIKPDVIERDTITLYKEIIGFKNQQAKLLPLAVRLAEGLAIGVDSFKQNLSLISNLCNPHLADRHADEIVSMLRLERKDLNIKTLTFITGLFENQLAADANKIKDRLTEISERADREFSNESILKDMKQKWEPVEFILKDWKLTKTYIFHGQSIDEMQTLLDDHLIKTQSMRGSPFAKVFEKEIIEWEAWLQNCVKVIEAWVKVQGVWVNLESVFSSEDIMQQLPKEGQLFKQVDKAWRDLMDHVKQDKHTLEVTKYPRLLEILEDCNMKLDTIQKQLNQYLESKRLKFPRFFFLSDGELIEILSETKDPLRVQKYLKKCFEGIYGLEFDNEKKIHSMNSSEGENVKLLKVIDPLLSKGMVEQWLQELEDEMMRCIRDVNEKCMNDYATKKRTKWVLDWPGQSILCCDMIFWTSKAERLMKAKGRLKNSLQCRNLNSTISLC
jgi:dynein heavy chain